MFPQNTPIYYDINQVLTYLSSCPVFNIRRNVSSVSRAGAGGAGGAGGEGSPGVSTLAATGLTAFHPLAPDNRFIGLAVPVDVNMMFEVSKVCSF